MLGLADGPGRESERFLLYCELTARACLLQIRAGTGHSPGLIAERLREHLGAAVPDPDAGGAMNTAAAIERAPGAAEQGQRRGRAARTPRDHAVLGRAAGA